MNSQRIEKLLERYYNGETSLQEDREIRDFFRSENIPAHLLSVKPQFDAIDQEAGDILPDDSFDRIILNKIEDGNIAYIRIRKKTIIFSAIAAAATILILITIFTRFNPFTSTIEDTLSDPTIAYNEAKKILLYVSGNFNKGTEKLQPLSSFDQGVAEMEKLSLFNDGLSQANKIDKYNKLDKIIKNPAQ
ncbi:MAG: hypothetical protein KKA81_04030 [Bacteroidetes bacterium]|nr:hypothetical protein [Bacteroidota bacterium]